MDSLASDGVMAARGSGEDPAGLSNRHGSEQQEHQHTLQRPSAELESSSGVNSGTGYANSVPAARPYATEQSLKVACTGELKHHEVALHPTSVMLSTSAKQPEAIAVTAKTF